MNTKREGPWREVDDFQRELNDVFGRWARAQRPAEYPPINIWTRPDDAIVVAELPGLDPSQVEITVLGDTLTLKGERAEPKATAERTYHRRERGSGPFNRTVQLAFRIEQAEVTASYEHGLLEIVLPRADEDRPQSISVTTS